MPTFRANPPPAPPPHLTAEYLAYLASPEWLAKRKRILARDGGFWCEWCVNAEAVEVHHLHYRRFGREDDDDLMAVCRLCHEVMDAHRKRFGWWMRRQYGYFWYNFVNREEWERYTQAIGLEAPGWVGGGN